MRRSGHHGAYLDQDVISRLCSDSRCRLGPIAHLHVWEDDFGSTVVPAPQIQRGALAGLEGPRGRGREVRRLGGHCLLWGAQRLLPRHSQGAPWDGRKAMNKLDLAQFSFRKNKSETGQCQTFLAKSESDCTSGSLVWLSPTWRSVCQSVCLLYSLSIALSSITIALSTISITLSLSLSS